MMQEFQILLKYFMLTSGPHSLIFLFSAAWKEAWS